MRSAVGIQALHVAGRTTSQACRSTQPARAGGCAPPDASSPRRASPCTPLACAPSPGLLTSLLVFSLAVNVLAAGPEGTAKALPAAREAALSASVPRVSGALAGDVAARLRVAFSMASQRLRELHSCAELFQPFHRDGEQQLAMTLYYAATARQEKLARQTGSVAFTFVGSPQTRLSRGFAALPVNGAAMILIHEALHFAGQEESPVTEGAPDSMELSLRVRRACRL